MRALFKGKIIISAFRCHYLGFSYSALVTGQLTIFKAYNRLCMKYTNPYIKMSDA